MSTKMTTWNRVSAAWVLLFGCLHAQSAHADETCTLRGEAILAKGVQIYDAPTAGSEIATFTGAPVQVSVTGFQDSMGGRAQVTTSGFRIRGYVRAKDFSVYTTRTVPVHSGHVWIAQGRKVRVLGSTGGKLHVEKTATFPLSGTFHGWAPCDSFSFAPGSTTGWTPEGGMRGYVMKKERADLFSEPRGDVVAAIEPSSYGDGVLLWGTERSGAWIRVEHHSEIILDGWVRAQDVSALPPGETMDQQTPGTSVPGSPRLQLQGNPKVVTTSREVSLRAKAGDASPPIGAIESGVEILVLDVVAGWASVLPRSLTLMPAESTQFWARVKDLGI